MMQNIANATQSFFNGRGKKIPSWLRQKVDIYQMELSLLIYGEKKDRLQNTKLNCYEVSFILHLRHLCLHSVFLTSRTAICRMTRCWMRSIWQNLIATSCLTSALRSRPSSLASGESTNQFSGTLS